MVRNAEQFADAAEGDTSNEPGMCLKQTRIWADIPSLYPDAQTAWNHANNRHVGDRHPPRGAAVYWHGGSSGFGHIAVSLGGGKVRSTDAGGSGNVKTVDLSWVENNWGLPYAGWADNINEVTIPGVGGGNEEEDDMPQYDHASASKDNKGVVDQWEAITWDNVASGKAFTDGSNVAKLGGRSYSANVHVVIDAPNGSTIRLRAVEVSDGNTDESNPQVETIATGGSTYAELNQIGHVADGRRWAVRWSCSQPATLLSADVTVLSW